MSEKCSEIFEHNPNYFLVKIQLKLVGKKWKFRKIVKYLA